MLCWKAAGLVIAMSKVGAGCRGLDSLKAERVAVAVHKGGARWVLGGRGRRLKCG